MGEKQWHKQSGNFPALYKNALEICDWDKFNREGSEKKAEHLSSQVTHTLILKFPAKVLHDKDGLNLNYAEVAKALKDGLGLSDEQAVKAAGFKAGPVSINVALTGTSHELRQDTRRTG